MNIRNTLEILAILFIFYAVIDLQFSQSRYKTDYNQTIEQVEKSFLLDESVSSESTRVYNAKDNKSLLVIHPKKRYLHIESGGTLKLGVILCCIFLFFSRSYTHIILTKLNRTQ